MVINAPALVPPDEKFWVRYSPHYEFRLSNVVSLALHVLVFGLLLLLVRQLGTQPVHQVPVEAVRLGGGGNPHSAGQGPAGALPPKEVGADEQDKQPTPHSVDAPGRPELNPVRGPDLSPPFDPDATRQLQRGNGLDLRRFREIEAALHGKLQPGASARGPGGEGPGGPGINKGMQGPVPPMQRWKMLFHTNNGPDYLRQLNGLGAILAIPVRETPELDYKLVRDLTRKPAQLLDEDLSKIQRIYWVDDKPQPVRDIMVALGLTLRPTHFVAFMPQELENKLFEMEKKAAGGKPVEAIRETKFRVKKKGDLYEPEVEEIIFK